MCYFSNKVLLLILVSQAVLHSATNGTTVLISMLTSWTDYTFCSLSLMSTLKVNKVLISVLTSWTILVIKYYF